MSYTNPARGCRFLAGVRVVETQIDSSFSVSHVACIGNETSLSQCKWRAGHCKKAVQVTCPFPGEYFNPAYITQAYPQIECYDFFAWPYPASANIKRGVYRTGSDLTWYKHIFARCSTCCIGHSPHTRAHTRTHTHTQSFSHMFTSTVDDTSSTAVRLAGRGPHTHTGRVEVLYRGAWGTVCKKDWSNTNSLIVCRQFGYRFV